MTCSAPHETNFIVLFFPIVSRLVTATDHWQHAAMKTFTSLITILFATVIATSSFAQTPATSPATATRCLPPNRQVQPVSA